MGVRSVGELLSMMVAPGYDPVAHIVAGERERGHKVVRPGDRPWFSTADWRPASVASRNAVSVRLVLLHRQDGVRGALERTLRAIVERGLKPSIIDPTSELEETLRRHGWHGVQMGRSFRDREKVWFPNPRKVW
jgi:hypothetical protein